MAFHSTSYTILLSIICNPYLITSQQPYADDICPSNDNTTSVLGYKCNGLNTTCQSFLIYRTQPPYNTLSSIASLLSANASMISTINNNSETMALATNTKVIVPVICSCSGQFYQTNTTHIVQAGENFFIIANNTFEGLTTCNTIRTQKVSPNVINILPNETLNVPLRFACPTRRQVNAGLRYLMSFVVQDGNSIADIAIKFGADVGKTLEANEKSEQDDIIQPFTTLLVPLKSPPNGSILEYPPYVPPSVSSPPSLPPTGAPKPPSSDGSSGRKWVYFGVGLIVGGGFVGSCRDACFLSVLKQEENRSNRACTKL